MIEREQKRIIPGVFVHVGKGPLQWKRIKRAREAWAAACRAAGHPGVLLHDFRRSGLRSLICSGVPERRALEISGHTTSGLRPLQHRQRAGSEGRREPPGTA